MGGQHEVDNEILGYAGGSLNIDGGTLLQFTGEVAVGVQLLADGDLAPFGNPDGVINAADVLIATQLALGQRTAGALQYAHGDMNGDEVFNTADLILIQQIVMQN